MNDHVTVPSPGALLGEERALALLAAIAEEAKHQLVEVERSRPDLPAALVTDNDHILYSAGVRSGALACWKHLYAQGLIHGPDGDQP